MRLEALGFANVFDYAGGKKDWMAEGMPVEGDRAAEARVGSLARIDPPTCRPGVLLSQLTGREEIEEWGLCVVTDRAGTVHGALSENAISSADPGEPVDMVMELAPVTLRPDASIEGTMRYLEERSLDSVLITTSRGRLIGVLTYHDLHTHAEKTAGTE